MELLDLDKMEEEIMEDEKETNKIIKRLISII